MKLGFVNQRTRRRVVKPLTHRIDLFFLIAVLRVCAQNAKRLALS